MGEQTVPARAFRVVETTHTVSGGALRQAEGGTLSVSGRLELNVGGTEVWHGLAGENGLSIEKAGTRFGVDETNNTVVAYPVDPGTAGGMPVRYYATKRVIAMHLGGVFKECPLLRPNGRRQVTVTRVLDAAGVPCLLIALQTGLIKRRSPKDSDSTDGKKQGAAAKPASAAAADPASTGTAGTGTAGEEAAE